MHAALHKKIAEKPRNMTDMVWRLSTAVEVSSIRSPFVVLPLFSPHAIVYPAVASELTFVYPKRFDNKKET
jgi:hypothetical protein